MTSTANYDNQSLRGFLQMVETDHPEELLRIRQPVDTRFDMTAIAFELERAGKSPVILFEKPAAYSMPVVTNVAGNRKLLAASLGVEPKDLPTAFRERCQKYIPCEVVTAASWHDVVIEGEDVDLTNCPSRCSLPSTAAPMSPPARFRHATRSPASTPPAFTG